MQKRPRYYTPDHTNSKALALSTGFGNLYRPVDTASLPWLPLDLVNRHLIVPKHNLQQALYHHLLELF